METLIVIKKFEDKGLNQEIDSLIKGEIMRLYSSPNLGFEVLQEKNFPKALFYNLVITIFSMISSQNSSIDELWNSVEVDEKANYDDFKTKDLQDVVDVSAKTIKDKTVVFGVIYVLCSSVQLGDMKSLKNLMDYDSSCKNIVAYFSKRLEEYNDYSVGKNQSRNVTMLNEWYDEVQMDASAFYRSIFALSTEEKLAKLEEKISDLESEIIPNNLYIEKLKEYHENLLYKEEKDYYPKKSMTYTDFAAHLCELVSQYYPNELEKTLLILKHMQYEIENNVFEKYQAILNARKESLGEVQKDKGFDMSQMTMLFYYLFVSLGLRDESKTDWARAIHEITGYNEDNIRKKLYIDYDSVKVKKDLNQIAELAKKIGLRSVEQMISKDLE